MWLSPAQARKLGHLYHAHVTSQSLSSYAQRQGLRLADLLDWERELVAQGIAVPERHRPPRFVAVEVVS